MQIWSFTVTLLSSSAMLIGEGKCAETVTSTNLTVTRRLLLSHFGEINDDDDDDDDDTSTNSQAAATTDLQQPHPGSDAVLGAEGDDQAEEQQSANHSSDTEQTEDTGNGCAFVLYI